MSISIEQRHHDITELNNTWIELKKLFKFYLKHYQLAYSVIFRVQNIIKTINIDNHEKYTYGKSVYVKLIEIKEIFDKVYNLIKEGYQNTYISKRISHLNDIPSSLYINFKNKIINDLHKLNTIDDENNLLFDTTLGDLADLSRKVDEKFSIITIDTNESDTDDAEENIDF